MAIRLAESLAGRHRFDPEDVMARYLDWWRDGAFDTGPVAAMVLSLVASGVPVEVAVARVHAESGGMTAGCNPAHRCPPLAMAAFIADAALPATAAHEASLTHHDPLAGDVAAAVAVLCRSLIRGDDWATALDKAAIGRDPATVRALEIGSPDPLSRGGYAPEVLRAAVHLVAGNSSFADALAGSIAFAGPANYCPVLVGAIGGARWGASSIPEGMMAHCEVLTRVRRVADQLASDGTDRG